MRHRMLEQPAIPEAVADRALQVLELVAKPDQLAVLQLGPVALDDPHRLFRFGVMNGYAHFSGSPGGEREDRLWHVRRHHRHDAVRFEKAADDAGFDAR